LQALEVYLQLEKPYLLHFGSKIEENIHWLASSPAKSENSILSQHLEFWKKAAT